MARPRKPQPQPELQPQPAPSTEQENQSAPEPQSKPRPPSPHRFRGQNLTISRGFPLPLGSRQAQDGVNFVVVSQHATAVWLVLSDPCSAEIQAEVPLDPVHNRTGHHWHIRVGGLPQHFCYGFRAHGPRGGPHRFDPWIVLLDPAAKALSCGRPWGASGRLPRRSLMVPSVASLPVSDDVPRKPRIPREDTIILELHVRGFTVHPSSNVKNPGTYSALAQKVPYLKDLGVTAVELLPIDEFDENDCPFINPITSRPLRNFWGYSTIAFGAPKAAYAVNPEGTTPWNEFRGLVQAFHAEGLEVILDVVFNHTAEGGDNGPTYSFRGLDNALYYMLDSQGRYLNFSGCGNTFNGNHAVSRTLLLSCLQDFVSEAEVDGFRFDLASVLGRDRRGNVLLEPPVINRFSDDPLLAETKLIAEPWDAGGLYQVADFPGGGRWSVWNGRYRDDVRRFWRGDLGMSGTMASRLCGSEDMFPHLSPLHSVNFITCHDGFTLNDLVSYNLKRNLANGENNRDGASENFSWNCGAEGPTKDPSILALRHRQARNLVATLLLSQGVPMLLAGDEFLRTQQGNNNAWCQDNEISWLDWSLASENADFHRFVRHLIHLRKAHPVLRRRTFFKGRRIHPPDIIWHGVYPYRPDFSYTSRTLAFTLDGRSSDRQGLVDRDIYIAMNAHDMPLVFRIPAAPTGRRWRRAADTALPSPDDASPTDSGPVIPPSHPYTLKDRSLVVLISEA